MSDKPIRNPEPPIGSDNNPWATVMNYIDKHTALVTGLIAQIEKQQQKHINTQWQQVTATNYENDLAFNMNVVCFYVDNSQNTNSFVLKRAGGGTYQVAAGATDYIYPLGGNYFTVESQPSATVWIQAIDTLFHK